MFSQPRSACVTPTPLLPHAWQTVKQVRNFSTLYTDHIRIEQELVYPLVEAGLTPESAENMGGRDNRTPELQQSADQPINYVKLSCSPPQI